MFLSALLVGLLFSSVAAQADFVLDWNKIAVDIEVAEQQNPVAQARYTSIVELAVFEAVNAVTGEYQPYLGTIVAAPGASGDAAAVQAAYDVLLYYFPGRTPQLNAHLANSLAQIADGQAKTDGRATGDAAAAAMIALRENDGSSVQKSKVPGPPVPGEWQATPSCPIIGGVAVGVFFHWKDVVPFGISRASDFLLDPPLPLASNQYAKTYNEVNRVGSVNSSDRTADRADVAFFYAVTSPAQVFNDVARQVAQQRGGHSLSENARALALMNMAISDSFVASFLNKYHYNFWRPETAIHAGDTDGNRKTDADPNYAPLITTPCFPSYPSNHGSASNGGAEVLRRLYREAGHAITLSNPGIPNIVLQYTSFKQITDDISDARVYGGIHFRADQDAGSVLGRAVGTAVFKDNLRPVHDKN